jgi:hypothetical protein
VRAVAYLPLIPILLLAAVLRLFGQDWDSGFHLHPDERFIVMVISKISLPGSIGAYFDTARSPLSPYNNGFDGFAYGLLPLFLGRWLAEVSGQTGYDRALYLGRTMSAFAEVGTTAFVYLLANRLYGRRVAVIAGLLMTLSVLDIQLSHFFAFDTFTTFFTAWSLYFAYRVWMGGRSLDAALLGLGVAFAVASKISAALLVAPLLLACLVPWPGRRRPSFDARLSALFVAGLAGLVGYRVAEPYAFLSGGPLELWRPNPKFVSDMLGWVQISSGEREVPYMIQWADTPKYTFALASSQHRALGPWSGRRARGVRRAGSRGAAASPVGLAGAAPPPGRLGRAELALFRWSVRQVHALPATGLPGAGNPGGVFRGLAVGAAGELARQPGTAASRPGRRGANRPAAGARADRALGTGVSARVYRAKHAAERIRVDGSEPAERRQAWH